MKTVCVVVGTRPEAIKMFPVVHALQAREGIDTRVCVTAQHRELLDQALRAFGMVPDRDLRVMKPGQSLSRLTSSILEGLEPVFERDRPDLVLAHGDTATCFATALSCFYQRIPMAHVEAGLRTRRLDSPFPEEFNRQSVARLAEVHFAPDTRARANLIQDSVEPSRIHVTGTTVIDAIRQIRKTAPRSTPGNEDTGPVSVITLHRRENGASELTGIFSALAQAARARPAMTFVYPVHPSPAIRHAAYAVLGDIPNVRLTEPMEYGAFIGLLARSHLVLTDSGGIQEEAALLGRNVLLLRDRSERPNGLAEGRVRLVGTRGDAIRTAVIRALDEPSRPDSDDPGPGPSPSGKIADEVARRVA